MKEKYALRKIEKDAFSYLCNDGKFYKQNTGLGCTFNPSDLKKFQEINDIEKYISTHVITGCLEIVHIIEK